MYKFAKSIVVVITILYYNIKNFNRFMVYASRIDLV